MTGGPRQRTLNAVAELAGVGLHTGENCRIIIHPAESDTGRIFVAEGIEVAGSLANVHDTLRGTNLSCGGAIIHTVEHLLAALSGLQVDNARIEVFGPELPACDGSALPFVELIEGAGIVEQQAEARILELSEPCWITNGDRYMPAFPGNGFQASAFISFANPMIGEQAASFRIDPDVFKREIAPARTFCTSAEIEALLSQGLGRGGRFDNVIVAYEDHFSTPLRYRDELVRHKILDLIGDLGLLGGRLSASVVAIKSSHALNTALAAKIWEKQQ
jgi:UDP-3-O-[3-hydroxymyristoyl] N-acetylglucosamine deacetylase